MFAAAPSRALGAGQVDKPVRVILRSMNIGGHIVQLRGAGAAGPGQYETRLRNNAANPEKLANLFCEGRAALMFLRNGWQVALREVLIFNSDGTEMWCMPR